MIHAPAKLPEVIGVRAVVARRRDRVRQLRPRGADRRRLARAPVGEPFLRRDGPACGAGAGAEYLEPLWRGEGLEPDPYAGAFRGLFVDLAPPSFAWEQPRGEVVRLRPVPDTAAAPPAWLDELEPPLVYVTMGTVYNEPELFRPLLDGLDGASAALVTVGRNVEPEALGPLPPRVRVERFVPQAHILPARAAVVSPRRLGNDARRARARSCRSCSCRRRPTSSTTPPAPRRPERPWSSGRAR